MSTPGTAPFLIPAPELTDAANIETAIEPLRDRIEVVLAQMLVPIGGLLAYAGSGDPAGGGWLLADGRLIDRTTYLAFFTAVGHAYNGGVDPGSNKVRLPDKRGRVPVGADNMGTAQGAANRLPSSNRTRGLNGGSDQQALTVGQIPLHAHPVEGYDNRFGAPAGPGAVSVNPTAGTNWGIPWGGGTALPANDGLGGAQSRGQSHNNMQPYEVDNMIVRVA